MEKRSSNRAAKRNGVMYQKENQKIINQSIGENVKAENGENEERKYVKYLKRSNMK